MSTQRDTDPRADIGYGEPDEETTGNVVHLLTWLEERAALRAERLDRIAAATAAPAGLAAARQALKTRRSS